MHCCWRLLISLMLVCTGCFTVVENMMHVIEDLGYATGSFIFPRYSNANYSFLLMLFKQCEFLKGTPSRISGSFSLDNAYFQWFLGGRLKEIMRLEADLTFCMAGLKVRACVIGIRYLKLFLILPSFVFSLRSPIQIANPFILHM